MATEARAPRRVVWLGGRLVAFRRALTAWLGRPLASFHLVLAVFTLLTVLGLVMVLSASTVISLKTGDGLYTVFKKQLLYVCVGAVVFWIGVRLPLAKYRAWSPHALVVSLLLLVLVLTPLGSRINGTQSWFTIGSIFSFQPVELAKVALALWGAHVLVVKKAVLHRYRHLLVPVVPAALLMFALVMLQPDLGGTVTLGVVLIALLWFAGAPLRLFGAIAIGGLAGVALLAVGAAYRLDRVMTFINPDGDSNKGYQARQARLALADGGVFGRGLGQGPSKWDFLPNVHNDFIFALIGDELGLLGCGLVLGLFAMLAVVGLRIATRNIDPWIKMVAATLTVWLVGQAAINIGYVVGLLPVTGITLPLISSGGTSIVVTMLVFGLLANCARHEPESVSALRSQGPGRFGKLMRLPAPDPYQPPKKRKPARPSSPPRGMDRPTGATARRPAPDRTVGRGGATSARQVGRPSARQPVRQPARQKTSRGTPRSPKGGRR